MRITDETSRSLARVFKRRKFLQMAFASAAMKSTAAIGIPAFAAPPKKNIFDVPTLSLLKATQVSITITVTAGANRLLLALDETE